MTNLSKYLIGAAALAAGGGTMAAEQPTVVAPSGGKIAYVSYADLDLRQTDDVATLRSRVRSAAKRVCNSTTIEAEFLTAGQAICMRRSLGEAANQIERARQYQLAGRTDITTLAVGAW